MSYGAETVIAIVSTMLSSANMMEGTAVPVKTRLANSAVNNCAFVMRQARINVQVKHLTINILNTNKHLVYLVSNLSKGER